MSSLPRDQRLQDKQQQDKQQQDKQQQDKQQQNASSAKVPVTSWGLDGGYVPACGQPGLYQAEASSWGDHGAYVPPAAEEENESMAEPFLLFA